MNCTAVRQQLLEIPVSAFSGLDAHLARCPECAALAAEIRAGHALLETELDDFSRSVSFREALALAREVDQQSTPTTAQKRWKMLDSGIHIGATFAAAATAFISVGLYSTTGSEERVVEAPLVEGGAELPSPCSALDELEANAMQGTLDSASVRCLEARVASDAGDLGDALSLLMVNAHSSGDMEAWRNYAELRAEQFPDEADIAYKLALYHLKGGLDSAEATLKYVDQAFENRTQWTGDTYITRVFNLRKIGASAASQLYRASPKDTKAEERAVEYAVDWLAYAKAAGQDTEVAYELCTSLTSADVCDDA
ncbi:MAG: hypothetical protein GWP91_23975 [Rhodobacterales bacterium]|nr:hypothetical protein [Rhodobacterales bacterium]